MTATVDPKATEPAWVATAEALERVVAALASEPAYAIDTEFHRERTYWPQLALVQLAWPGGLALVDPVAVDLHPLRAVLEGPGVAVLHAADQDLEVLERASGTLPARLFDTQVAAGFLGFSSPSLSSLTDRLLGLHLTKGDRLTDWMQRPLTAAQRRYAAADVAHLLDLHAELTRRLEDCGRLDWAAQECEVLRQRGHLPQDPDTAWWRIKDSRSLRGPARGVAQEVAAWRERRAAVLDRPPRLVLPDLALLGIAHRMPDSPAGLRDIRGLDGRYLRSDAAEELLAAVARGRRLARKELRLPVSDELERNLRPAVTLVSAWVSQLAQELRIDPVLLATRADLLALLRGDRAARLGTGWRATLVGDRIRQLVDGRAALAFRPGRGDLVLEARSGTELSVEVAVPVEVAPAVVED
ncbi:MAG: ribonuclease D [Actinobacteria bacterium]|nr:ribonuclease D [Actinomycetota bacterium]MBW3649801.1 ribonuclease D [Actinomycetota bacterium]